MSYPSTPSVAKLPAAGNQLESVIAEFNRVSAELGGAWSDLENQVAHLSAELSTARSAKLRELADKEALADKLSAIMEAMPAGIVVIGADGRIEDVNTAAAALLGSEAKGRCWRQALANIGGTDILQGEFDATDGRRLTLAVTERGDRSRIALLTDISDGHRLRQTLQREQRLRELGDMAARLAHQLRTPLSSAMLYLSQLGEATPQDAATAIGGRAMARLYDIERLVEGMLQFIRGAEEPLSEFCPAALARETAAGMSVQLEAARARFSLHYPDSATRVTGRRELLKNALVNLLDNAITNGGTGVQISLTVATDSGVASLAVLDNGPGVQAGLEESIFEPWFTTRQHGTGLGLAIVRSAAEAHGGKVRLHRPEAGGSCFTLSIPLHPAEESS